MSEIQTGDTYGFEQETTALKNILPFNRAFTEEEQEKFICDLDNWHKAYILSLNGKGITYSGLAAAIVDLTIHSGRILNRNDDWRLFLADFLLITAGSALTFEQFNVIREYKQLIISDHKRKIDDYKAGLKHWKGLEESQLPVEKKSRMMNGAKSCTMGEYIFRRGIPGFTVVYDNLLDEKDSYELWFPIWHLQYFKIGTRVQKSDFLV